MDQDAGPSAPAPANVTNAQARWELENEVATTSDLDALFRYDAEEQKAIQAQKPWTRDPHYFKRCAGAWWAPGSRWGGRSRPDHTPCRNADTAHGRTLPPAANCRRHSQCWQPACLLLSRLTGPLPPLLLPRFPSSSVRVSALALLKMAMHAKTGGNLEVMGVMQVGRGTRARLQGEWLLPLLQWMRTGCESGCVPLLAWGGAGC